MIFDPDLNMVLMQLLSSALFTVTSNIETNVRREDRAQYEFLQGKKKKVTKRERGWEGRLKRKKREKESIREVTLYQRIELISVDSALWRL